MRRREAPPDFEYAFDALFPRAESLAKRILVDEDLAEQAATEALAHAYARWSRVRTLPRPDGWVLRVTANLAVDAVKRLPEPPSDLAAGLAALPRGEAEAVVLRYLTELGDHEVAQILDMSEATFRARVDRGLRSLRGKLPRSTKENPLVARPA